MTVIAYRDGVLAADTLVTSGLDRVGQTLKIRRVASEDGEWLIGASGSLGSITPLDNWITSGANLNQPVDYPSGQEGSGVLISPDGKVYYTDTETRFLSELHAPFVAIGCGSTSARVAMMLDCTAIEAVEAVIEVDAACGGKPVWLTLNGEEDLSLLS